jgi:hypothetical protein
MGFMNRFLGLLIDEAENSDFKSMVTGLQLNILELRTKMAQEVDDLKARLEAATDELASDLADLRTRLENGVPVSEVVSALNPVIERLENMGKDAENPVPEVVTDPSTTVDPATSPATDPTQVVVDENGNPELVDPESDDSGQTDSTVS